MAEILVDYLGTEISLKWRLLAYARGQTGIVGNQFVPRSMGIPPVHKYSSHVLHKREIFKENEILLKMAPLVLIADFNAIWYLPFRLPSWLPNIPQYRTE